MNNYTMNLLQNHLENEVARLRKALSFIAHNPGCYSLDVAANVAKGALGTLRPQGSPMLCAPSTQVAVGSEAADEVARLKCEGFFKPKEQEIPTKPPLGIVPEWLWREERMWDLIHALSRHSEAPVEIHIEWFLELERRLANFITRHDEKVPKVC